jgi:hypothetical protein
MPKTYRIQIDLSEEGYNQLELLIKECGFATKREFFDNAISLMKWAASKARSGRSIASVDEKQKQYNELEMPFLQRIREKAAKVVSHATQWTSA